MKRIWENKKGKKKGSEERAKLGRVERARGQFG